MKIFKRCSAVLLTLCLMMQAAVFAAPSPSDVAGTQYEEAINALCALDIMVGDGTNFNPDNTITRGEITQVLANMFNYTLFGTGYAANRIFTDVPTSNVFAKAIEWAKNRNIINGYGDGTFGPDNEVTGNEVVKMMVCALNYGVVAETNGGFPSGYLATASSEGILRGLGDVNFALPITRAQVAKLALNTLNTDLLQEASWGSDEIRYETRKNETILSEYHKIYRYEGVVTATDVTSIVGDGTVKDGYIQITANNESYNFDASSLERGGLLGQYVEVYYTADEENDVSTIQYLAIKEKQNDAVSVSLKDVNFSKSNSDQIVYFNENGREEKIYIANLPSLVFNGSTDTARNLGTVLQAVREQDGTITCIDNDNNHEYDVIRIQAYTTYFVGQVYAQDYLITDQFGRYDETGKKINKTLTIDLDDREVKATFKLTDGSAAEFANIKKNDILTVAMNDANKVKPYDITISRNSVEGVISEMAEEGGSLRLVIDGVSYETTASFLNYVTKGSDNLADVNLKVGNSGLFYLDSMGKIAAYDLAKGITEDNLAFGVITAYSGTGNTIEKPQVRIYSGGTLKIYNMTGKVTVDGLSYAAAGVGAALDEVSTEIKNAGITYYDGASAIPVLFRADEAGNVKYIDTVVYRANAESENSLHYVRGTDVPASHTYMSNSQTFDYKYKVANAKVVQIPGKSDEVSLNRAERYSSYTTTSLANDQPYTVQLFNTDPDSYKVDYILRQQSATGGFTTLGDNDTEIHNKQMFLVSKVSAVVDEEGNKTIKIYGLEEGRGKEFLVNADYYAESFHDDMWDMEWFTDVKDQLTESTERKEKIVLPGDIIRYRTNANGEIAYVRAVFLSDVKAFKCDDQGGLQSGMRYRAKDIAVVSSLDGSEMQLRYLIDKNRGGGNYQKAMILNVNEAGYLLTDQAGTKLYDENTGIYCEGDTAGEWNVNAIFDASDFSIMVYDATETGEEKVRTGSVADLYDTTAGGKPASIVIMQFRASAPRGMIILKLA